MKTLDQIIQEAYIGMYNTIVESKFKVGDKVGSGHHGDMGSYFPYDTGTVTKVNSNGHHTVEFDNKKSPENKTKNDVGEFDADGLTKIKNSEMYIMPIENHQEKIKKYK